MLHDALAIQEECVRAIDHCIATGQSAWRDSWQARLRTIQKIVKRKQAEEQNPFYPEAKK